MKLERCPSCRARLNGAVLCPRCGADLEYLARIKGQVRRRIEDAIESAHLGDRDLALKTLHEIESLDKSFATKRISDFLYDRLAGPRIRRVGAQAEEAKSEPILRAIIDAATEVYRALGEGLALSAYDDCLSREMALRGLDFERGYPVAVTYRGLRLRDCGRFNQLVEARVAVLLCPARQIERYQSRCGNFLRLGGWPSGLVIDFNAD